MVLWGYILGALYGGFCLLSAHVAYKLGVPKIYTRKLVHILVGFEWVILYYFMGRSVHFLVVCLAFTALLAVTYFARLFPMISSDGDNSPGTVYYGVSMSVMSAVALWDARMMLPFGIAVFATSFGDGFAGVLGQAITKHNPRIYKGKSLVGFLTNLTVSTAVVFAFMGLHGFELLVWQVLAIGIFAAGIELISEKGLDNIFLPLGVFALLMLFILHPSPENYIIPIILTPFIIMLVNISGALTPAATLAAVALDIAVSVAFGNVGFVFIMAFLGGSLVIDRFKKKYRANILKAEKNGSSRNIMQVFANGGVPLVLSLLYLVYPNETVFIAFCASVAEAFADTAASGIGVFSKSAFDPFRMRRCKVGISGGMSLLGTLASLLGAFLVALIALAFGKANITAVAVIALAAFLGALVDSALGSLLQVKYKCEVCGEITEKEEHCGKATVKHSGLDFIDNDVVNCLSAAFSAAISIPLYNLII